MWFNPGFAPAPAAYGRSAEAFYDSPNHYTLSGVQLMRKRHGHAVISQIGDKIMTNSSIKSD